MTRIAVIEKEKCNPIGCGNHLCIRLCPINRTGKECIVKDSDNKVKINEELCTGCGICTKRCPFGALHIINLPEELDSEPIHRYGQNGFSLYNLPAPQPGKVVGILGKNAIGKSTVMKILSGNIKPNFGKEKEATYDDLIKHFRGSETQTFFEKMKEGKIKTSFKPQQVDAIPKIYSGKVIDLLKKSDEKGILENISETLELKNILESNLSEISGGELQRVAIAACVMKEADVYFFDEPTSFLDIKQRIKISKFIRSLADDSTSVMVIDHDLIILDYIADVVHIVYGKENCYGIVSHPKATRTAINVYLSGFSREDNIRFRNHEIKFEKRPQFMGVQQTSLVGWDSIKKQLGKFNLKSEKGDIKTHDVVGILGENGIGKTSFVKILAGVIKQDSGDISSNIKVSYKPQYIETNSDELVVIELQDAVKKFKVELIEGLNITPFLNRKVSELSGGQLQCVAIAKCLSEQADLYLLDEPSAYLDVEQRLKVSKVIRDLMEIRGKSALVVDHDLLFIDYISKEIAVFFGVPAIEGKILGPFDMETGMNLFLEDLNLTFRRDPESNRPRANKLNSQMDEKQKKEKKLYYS